MSSTSSVSCFSNGVSNPSAVTLTAPRYTPGAASAGIAMDTKIPCTLPGSMLTGPGPYSTSGKLSREPLSFLPLPTNAFVSERKVQETVSGGIRFSPFSNGCAQAAAPSTLSLPLSSTSRAIAVSPRQAVSAPPISGALSSSS